MGNRDDNGLFLHIPELYRDSTGVNQDVYTGSMLVHLAAIPVVIISKTLGHNCDATGVNQIATGVNRDATRVNRDDTVVKPKHTGLCHDDTMEEPGTRPGLQRGNTVTEKTINFGRNSYPVIQGILACLHRGRTGTVRTGLREWKGNIF